MNSTERALTAAVERVKEQERLTRSDIERIQQMIDDTDKVLNRGKVVT